MHVERERFKNCLIILPLAFHTLKQLIYTWTLYRHLSVDLIDIKILPIIRSSLLYLPTTTTN